ncbi:MAG TPA: ATP synthase F1 subunit delta [Bacteroidota bacterium]|nr:ATP synthase F1 subunit delta [Bacteroidota bacterium]
MSNIRAAERYASAALSVAEELKSVDEVSNDFAFIEKMHREIPDFRIFLKSPVVNKEKKARVFAQLLGGKVSLFTEKFVLLLASKGRENILPEIIRQFYDQRDKQRGILHVRARVAVKFSDAQHRALVHQIETATKKTPRIEYVLDPSLKGGFIVQHEDTVWDASVRHQLDILRRRFAEGGS